MAWYTINHKCGHTEEVQLYGPNRDRERKIMWMKSLDCPKCRIKKANDIAKQFNLQELKGSESQVAWAEEIRNDRMIKINDMLKDALKNNTPENVAKVAKMQGTTEEHIQEQFDQITTAIKAVRDDMVNEIYAGRFIEDKDLSMELIVSEKVKFLNR